jgi:hypothetical protein
LLIGGPGRVPALQQSWSAAGAVRQTCSDTLVDCLVPGGTAVPRSLRRERSSPARHFERLSVRHLGVSLGRYRLHSGHGSGSPVTTWSAA